MADDAVSLMKAQGLTEREWTKPITDKHINDISRSYCTTWKYLCPYLGVESIVAGDIAKNAAYDEEEKRVAFFKKWKLIKGSDATYKQLISALLQIRCRNDAEGVCKILRTDSTASAAGAAKPPEDLALKRLGKMAIVSVKN